MNCRDDQEKLRRPEVNIADKPTEWDEVADGLYGLRSLIRRGDVIEHFENARCAQHEHQEYGRPARSERVSPARLFSGNSWWMKVVKESRAHLNTDK